MLITRETDYAIRILRNLNMDTVMSIHDIAPKELITVTIAHKVARILHKKGLIKSKRGVSGGYTLGRPLNEITLLDVYLAMDNSPYINACLDPEEHCPLDKKRRGCGVHQELYRIQNILHEELQRHNLDEIINGQIA